LLKAHATSNLNFGIFALYKLAGKERRWQKMFKFCGKCVAMRQFLEKDSLKTPRTCDVCGNEE
jgi:hypothetical protein